MSDPVLFIVPGELISSKNSRNSIPMKSRSTGKTKWVPMKSGKAQDDEERLMSLFLSQHGFRAAWLREIALAGFPVRLRMKIYRQTDRRFDYVNIVQNLLDCLVKAELLPDDDAKHVIPAYEPYLIDKANPRTEITIEAVR